MEMMISAGWKAQRARHVEVDIAVMHLVDAPEQRPVVRDDMLQPDGEIERDKHERWRPARRNVDHVEQAEPGLFGPQRHTHGCRREENPQDKGIDDQHAPIGQPTPSTRRKTLAARQQLFEHRHRDENADKGAKPDRGFGKFRHANLALVWFHTAIG
jgi:hypothetical protein